MSGVLDPKVRSAIPKEIYDRSVAMNAAFALNWSQLTGNPQAVLPYKVLGYVERGERLLKHLDRIHRESLDLYSRAVDSWASDLDMRDWYSWLYRES